MVENYRIKEEDGYKFKKQMGNVLNKKFFDCTFIAKLNGNRFDWNV